MLFSFMFRLSVQILLTYFDPSINNKISTHEFKINAESQSAQSSYFAFLQLFKHPIIWIKLVPQQMPFPASTYFFVGQSNGLIYKSNENLCGGFSFLESPWSKIFYLNGWQNSNKQICRLFQSSPSIERSSNILTSCLLLQSFCFCVVLTVLGLDCTYCKREVFLHWWCQHVYYISWKNIKILSF